MGINVKWDVTYKCNLNCSHCLNGDFLGKIDNELTTEELQKVICNLSTSNVQYVHLLGGEPLARNDIESIFELFERYEIDFGFNTNGLKIGKQSIINSLVNNSRLKNIVFSIEGPTAEINDAIRGKNVFDITVKNMKKFIELKKQIKNEKPTITVNTVVSEKNIDYIIDMISFCENLGADEIVLLQFLRGGNAKDLDISIDAKEEKELVAKIAKYYTLRKPKINIVPRFTYPLAKIFAKYVLELDFPELFSMCGAGDDFYYINNKGDLFPCDRYRELTLQKYKQGEICLTDNNFWDVAQLEIFSDPFIICEGEKTYKKFHPCNICPLLRKKCYPCIVGADKVENVYVQSCMEMMEEIKKCIE